MYNVKLIIIPYWIDLTDMESYLKAQLDKLGLPYHDQFIDWKRIIKKVRLDAYKSSNKIRDILSFSNN